MMTKNEAVERAARIWPKRVNVWRAGNLERWMVETPDGRYHVMDENGHTKCHPDCARIEEKI
jgi:hypothetical protein